MVSTKITILVVLNVVKDLSPGYRNRTFATLRMTCSVTGESGCRVPFRVRLPGMIGL